MKSDDELLCDPKKNRTRAREQASRRPTTHEIFLERKKKKKKKKKNKYLRFDGRKM